MNVLDTGSQGLQEVRFPSSHGLTVGASTPYTHALIEAHFNSPTADDESGFQLRLTESVTPHQVGVMQMTVGHFAPLAPHEALLQLRETAPLDVTRPIALLGVHFHYHQSGVGGEMRDTCGVGSGRAPVSSSSSAVGPEPREIEEISLLIQIATFGREETKFL